MHHMGIITGLGNKLGNKFTCMVEITLVIVQFLTISIFCEQYSYSIFFLANKIIFCHNHKIENALK